MPLPTRELGKGNRPVTKGFASEAPTTGVLGAAGGCPKKIPVATDDPLPRSPGLEPIPPLPGAKNWPYPARNTVFGRKVHARPTRGPQFLLGLLGYRCELVVGSRTPFSPVTGSVALGSK